MSRELSVGDAARHAELVLQWRQAFVLVPGQRCSRRGLRVVRCRRLRGQEQSPLSATSDAGRVLAQIANGSLD